MPVERTKIIPSKGLRAYCAFRYTWPTDWHTIVCSFQSGIPLCEKKIAHLSSSKTQASSRGKPKSPIKTASPLPSNRRLHQAPTQRSARIIIIHFHRRKKFPFPCASEKISARLSSHHAPITGSSRPRTFILGPASRTEPVPRARAGCCSWLLHRGGELL